jgi:hypothetical protein
MYHDVDALDSCDVNGCSHGIPLDISGLGHLAGPDEMNHRVTVRVQGSSGCGADQS